MSAETSSRPAVASPAAPPAGAGIATGVAPAVASTAAIALALGAVYVIWGSTYLAMRLAIASIPPCLMAGTRHFAAGAVLYAFARLRGAPRPRPVHWRSAAVIGFLLLMIGNGGVVWAEQRVPSGMAALLICSEPMWIVLFAWMRRDGRRPAARVVGGLLLGFAGLMVLVQPGAGAAAGTVDRLGALALLFASVAWAAGSLYVQRATLPDSPLLGTAMQMLCGGVLLLSTGLLTGEPAHFAWHSVTGSSAAALLYLVIFGSLIGFTAYTWLLRVASPVLVSTYAYVNPVVAVFLGWLLVREPVTLGTLAGAAVILSGVALITTAAVPGHGTARPRPVAAAEPAPSAHRAA